MVNIKFIKNKDFYKKQSFVVKSFINKIRVGSILELKYINIGFDKLRTVSLVCECIKVVNRSNMSSFTVIVDFAGSFFKVKFNIVSPLLISIVVKNRLKVK